MEGRWCGGETGQGESKVEGSSGPGGGEGGCCWILSLVLHLKTLHMSTWICTNNLAGPDMNRPVTVTRAQHKYKCYLRDLQLPL